MSALLVAALTTATSTTEEIVVTGGRIEQLAELAPVVTEIIGRETIESSGAETVADLLEEHSGVQVVRSFRGASIEMHGLDADYVLVLVDGQRTIGRVDGAIDLSRFPVDRIDRIEIVKGASSALYGADALGGVVNIITKRTRRPLEASGHATYGSFNRVDLGGSVGGIAGPFRLRLSAGWHRADHYDLTPDEPSTSGSAFDTIQVEARADVDASEELTWRGRVDWTMRALDGIDAGSVAIFERKNRQQSVSFALGPQIHFGTATLQVTAYGAFHRDQFLQDQRNASALDSLSDTRELIGQVNVQLDQMIGSQNILSIGIEGMYERIQSERLSEGSGAQGRLAAFIQNEWSIEEAAIVPGIRIDLDSQFGIYATPKLAVLYRLLDEVTLRASVGRGFKAPTFREQLLFFENPTAGYLVRGNPDLRPETSWSYQLAVEIRPLDMLRVSVSAFRNDVDNLITTVSAGLPAAGEPQLFTYENVAEARTQGIEARVRLLLSPSFRADAGYTLLDAVDEENDRRLEGRAAHRFVLGLTASYAPWGISGTARGSIVGPRPFYVDEVEVDADPYATIDLRVEKTLFTEHASIFAGADNLLDAGDARFLPIPPRTFYAGLWARY